MARPEGRAYGLTCQLPARHRHVELTDRADAVAEPVDRQVGHVLGDPDAAAGELDAVAELPGAAVDPYALGAVGEASEVGLAALHGMRRAAVAAVVVEHEAPRTGRRDPSAGAQRSRGGDTPRESDARQIRGVRCDHPTIAIVPVSAELPRFAAAELRADRPVVELQAAQIGTVIEAAFGAGGPGSGVPLLLLGFAVASLMKIAQGSSTVAMITTAAMLAAMIPAAGGLPFHTVYVATAIASGSLVGTWMNDSGFWVFSKMGGVPEIACSE